MRLRLSLSKTYALLDSGKLGCHRMDGAIRISEEQLEEYLQATKRERGEAISTTRKPPRPQLRHVRLS